MHLFNMISKLYEVESHGLAIEACAVASLASFIVCIAAGLTVGGVVAGGWEGFDGISSSPERSKKTYALNFQFFLVLV